MKEVKTNSSGDLSAVKINYFGGTYSFWELLFKKGIGSSRVVYLSGIPTFDALYRNIEGELGLVNFELLKNGLIMRLNINQRIKVVGARLTDIQQINLVAHRVEIMVQKGSQYVPKIIYRAALEIVETTGSTGQFSILARDFKDLKDYFERAEFKDKLHFSISTNPPEKEATFDAEWLDLMIGFLG